MAKSRENPELDKLRQTKGEREALKLARERGELLRKDSVQAGLMRLGDVLVARLQAVPGRVVPVIRGATSEAEAMAKAEAEIAATIRDVREALASVEIEGTVRLLDALTTFDTVEEIDPVELCERVRWIPADLSTRPGRYSTETMPYQREPLRAAMEHRVRTLTLLAASQVGKSIILENILLARSLTRPVPALWCHPDVISRQHYTRKRLGPMIQASPEWEAALIAGKRAIKETMVQFQRMTLYSAIASSRSQLSSKAIGLGIADEIDGYPKELKGEGSPLDTFRARMRTHPAGLFAQSSTPTDPEGNVAVEFDKSDRREWMVHCPKCGAEHAWETRHVKFLERPREKSRLEWSQLLKADPSMAWWECPSCLYRAAQGAKLGMNQAGRYVATGSSGDHAGFRIPSLCSPFTTFNGLASAWLEAVHAKESGDLSKMKHFVIHEEARPWELASKRVEVAIIQERVDNTARGTVPQWVRFLTVGADVQEDRVYWTAWAWGANRRGHLVDHGAGVDLEDFAISAVRREYRREDGEAVRPCIALIDSGYRTTETYEFCHSRGGGIIQPVKGFDRLTERARWKKSVAEIIPSRGHAGEIPLLLLNVSEYKGIILTLLGKDAATREGLTFHAGVDDTFARQLVAEHFVQSRDKNGRKRFKWVLRRGYQSNHFLDCSVYALAAYEVAGGLVLPRGAPAEASRTTTPGAIPGERIIRKPVSRETLQTRPRRGW